MYCSEIFRCINLFSQQKNLHWKGFWNLRFILYIENCIWFLWIHSSIFTLLKVSYKNFNYRTVNINSLLLNCMKGCVFYCVGYGCFVSQGCKCKWKREVVLNSSWRELFSFYDLVYWYLIFFLTVLNLPTSVEEVCPNIPSLMKLMEEIVELAESGIRYTQMPHIMEVILPMLCSYMSHWWEHGPENNPDKAEMCCTALTSEHMNTLLGNILKIIYNNLGIDEGAWMKRLAGKMWK